MGILARSLLGNLSIWMEILTFEIKSIINRGKSDDPADSENVTSESSTSKLVKQLMWVPKNVTGVELDLTCMGLELPNVIFID